MRFHADGPSIPSELLDARDRGNVVFFCGAGVSRPAGLPSFSELARRVMKALGTDATARSRTLLEQPGGAESLDRVFNLLQQEYRQSTAFSKRLPVRAHLPTPQYCGCRPVPLADRALLLRISITCLNGQPSPCRYTSLRRCRISEAWARLRGWCTCTVGDGTQDLRPAVQARYEAGPH